MAKPLRVLIVEDLEDDALLVIRELERGGYDTTFERVETAEAMTAALEKQVWDIIIADYSLPHFSAPEALELFHQSGLDLPFIVISGTIGEETAVATMKAGAHDYLMKGNLTRLVPAIERELHDAEMRKERKQAEEALRLAEQNFRNSLDNSPLGIRIVTAEGELLYANQAILDIYGYSSVEELKAMLAKQRYTPKSYAESQERIKKRKLGKPVPSEYEISIVRRDGEIRHLAVSRKEVMWDGEIQFQTLYQDITGRKRAEEAVRESEERLKILFELAPDAYYLNDLKGKFIDGNKAAEEITGYKKEELIGKSFLKLKLLSPKQIPKAAALLAKSALRQSTGPDELILNRKDGTQVPVEIRSFPVKIKDQALVLAIARDITERKRAEEERVRLATAIDQVAEIVFITDINGTIQYTNPAFERITGYTQKEAIGKNPRILQSGKHNKEFYRKMWDRLTRGEVWTGFHPS